MNLSPSGGCQEDTPREQFRSALTPEDAEENKAISLPLCCFLQLRAWVLWFADWFGAPVKLPTLLLFENTKLSSKNCPCHFPLVSESRLRLAGARGTCAGTQGEAPTQDGDSLPPLRLPHKDIGSFSFQISLTLTPLSVCAASSVGGFISASRDRGA